MAPPTALVAATLDTSTLISLGALVLAALSYRRAGGADRRDKEQHDAAQAADAAKKRAELHVVSQERMTHRKGEPTISITNNGPAIARNVRAWLDDERGSRVSSVAGDENPVTIARRSQILSVTVDDAVADEDVASLLWVVEWQDDRDDGRHKLDTGVRPPPPTEPMVQVF